MKETEQIKYWKGEFGNDNSDEMFLLEKECEE